MRRLAGFEPATTRLSGEVTVLYTTAKPCREQTETALVIVSSEVAVTFTTAKPFAGNKQLGCLSLQVK